MPGPIQILSASLFGLLLPLATLAQDSATSNVLERYGNLEIERSGAAIDPELARKMLRRGNTYSNLQRFEEAIEEYRKALAADPNLEEALRNRANVYLFLERGQQARPLLARYIALQENSSASLIAAVQTLGQLEREAGNFEVAIDYDLRAIRLTPDDDSQIHIMANSYNNAGDADKAIAIYRTATEVQPDNAFFHRSLGRILEQQGQLSEALESYQAAAAIEPSVPAAMYKGGCGCWIGWGKTS